MGTPSEKQRVHDLYVSLRDRGLIETELQQKELDTVLKWEKDGEVKPLTDPIADTDAFVHTWANIAILIGVLVFLGMLIDTNIPKVYYIAPFAIFVSGVVFRYITKPK